MFGPSMIVRAPILTRGRVGSEILGRFGVLSVAAHEGPATSGPVNSGHKYDGAVTSKGVLKSFGPWPACREMNGAATGRAGDAPGN